MSGKRIFTQQSYLNFWLLRDLRLANAGTSRKKLKILQNSSALTKTKTTKLIKLVGGDPTSVVSRFKMPKKRSRNWNKNFLNLSPAKLSMLVPEVRLYLLDPDDRKGKKLIPFYFPVSTDYTVSEVSGRIINKGSSAGKERGVTTETLMSPFTAAAAAIEDFSVNLRGNNLYEVGRKQLDAKLSISLDNLTKLFDVPDNTYAPLCDLFMIRSSTARKKFKATGKKPSGNALKNGKSLQIVATLGYSTSFSGDIFSSDEIRQIQKSKIIINLFYGGQHDISLKEDGSAKVSVSYNGFLSATEGDMDFDVIASSKAKAKNLKRRATLTIDKEAEPKSINKTNKSQSANEKKEDELVEVDDVAFSQRKDIFKKAIKKLFGNPLEPGKSKLYVFDYDKPIDAYLSRGELSNKGGTTNAPDKQKAWIQTFNFDYGTEPNKRSPLEIYKRHRYINYVLLGDFVHAFISETEDVLLEMRTKINKQKKKTPEVHAQEADIAQAISALSKQALMFSDITLRPVERPNTSDEKYNENLSDIPITLDNLCTTFYDEVSSVSTKNAYSLKEFIENFTLSLLQNSLRELSGTSVFKNVLLRSVPTFGAEPATSETSNGSLQVNIGNVSRGVQTPTNNIQYIIYAQQATWTTTAPGDGDQSKDIDNGIIHLSVSKNQGLVKTIQFTQIDIPGKKEYHVAADGHMFDELRVPTNATVTMFGNSIFNPGMIIYINPNSIGFGDPRGFDAAAVRLGIGGYYTILSVNTSFSKAGSLTTTLTCAYLGPPESAKDKWLTPERQAANEEAINMATGQKP